MDRIEVRNPPVTQAKEAVNRAGDRSEFLELLKDSEDSGTISCGNIRHRLDAVKRVSLKIA
jgi:hypothetical protein